MHWKGEDLPLQRVVIGEVLGLILYEPLGLRFVLCIHKGAYLGMILFPIPRFNSSADISADISTAVSAYIFAGIYAVQICLQICLHQCLQSPP